MFHRWLHPGATLSITVWNIELQSATSSWEVSRSLTSSLGFCFATKILTDTPETGLALGFIIKCRGVPLIGSTTRRTREFNCPSWLLFIHPSRWLAWIQVVTQVFSRTSGQLFISPALWQLAVVHLWLSLPSHEKSSLSLGVSSFCAMEINLEGTYMAALPFVTCPFLGSHLHVCSCPIHVLSHTPSFSRITTRIDYLSNTPAGFLQQIKSLFLSLYFSKGGPSFQLNLLDWQWEFTMYFSQNEPFLSLPPHPPPVFLVCLFYKVILAF